MRSENKRFNFWHKWLLIVSILNILIGIWIAFAPESVLFRFYTAAISDAFFQGDITPEGQQLRSFLFGIIGGTIAGYFLLQSLIVWIPFYRRERWAWHAVLWFVIDSSLSIYHGAFFNVWMINVWPLLLIGIALMMTRRDFINISS